MKSKNSDEELTVQGLRVSVGLTQEEVARRVGCSSKTISLWDNRAKMPSITNAALLAKEYKVSLKTLFKAFGIDVSAIPNDGEPPL